MVGGPWSRSGSDLELCGVRPKLLHGNPGKPGSGLARRDLVARRRRAVLCCSPVDHSLPQSKEPRSSRRFDSGGCSPTPAGTILADLAGALAVGFWSICRADALAAGVLAAILFRTSSVRARMISMRRWIPAMVLTLLLNTVCVYMLVRGSTVAVYGLLSLAGCRILRSGRAVYCSR